MTDLRPEDLIKEEDVVVMTTQSGYIKRTSLSSYHFQMRGGKGRKGISMKAEDVVDDVFVCSTHSYLLVFTNIGRVYWLKALEIPDVGVSGRGKAIVNLLEFQPGEQADLGRGRQGFRRGQVRSSCWRPTARSRRPASTSSRTSAGAGSSP